MTTITLTATSASTRRDMRRAIDQMHDRDDSAVKLATIRTERGRGVSLDFPPQSISAEEVRVQSRAIHRQVMLAAGTTSIDCDVN